jgi:hypothetical protein
MRVITADNLSKRVRGRLRPADAGAAYPMPPSPPNAWPTGLLGVTAVAAIASEAVQATLLDLATKTLVPV